MSDELEDYHWLLSEAAEPWIAEASQADTLRGGEMVRLVQRLRKTLSPQRAHLVVELADLRRRAREKFAAADRMFFTRVSLEQATDERIAAYKAERLGDGQRVADLCCGIGGDLLAIGSRGAATGVDASEVTAAIAGRNCEVLGISSADVVCGRAEEVCLADYDAWHIDPDRRLSGKRTTRLELHEPPLETLERLLRENGNGAVKLAPAAEIPAGWEERVECEWIGSRDECRQLVVWHGDLAQPGIHSATIVDAGGNLCRVHGGAKIEPLIANQIGRYLYEPHAVMLAAGMTGLLGQRHSLAAVAPRIAYLTGDDYVSDRALDSFEVLETLPFDLKRLAALLAQRNIGQVEVKKRGVDVDPLMVQKKLQTKAEASAVILLIPCDKRVLAVVARRVKPA